MLKQRIQILFFLFLTSLFGRVGAVDFQHGGALLPEGEVVKPYVLNLHQVDSIITKLDQQGLNTLDYFILKGKLLKNEQRYQEAVDVFLNVLNNESNASLAPGLIYENLADAYFSAGLFKEAGHYYKMLLQNTDASNLPELGNIYINIGLCGYNNGEYSTALSYMNQALKVFFSLKDTAGIIDSYLNIGLVYDISGEAQQSITIYKKALDLCKKFQSCNQQALLFNNIGIAYFQLKQYNIALAYYQQSLLLEKQNGQEKDVAISYHNLANVYELKGNFDMACEHYLASLKIEQKLGNIKGVIITQTDLANLMVKMKNFESAEELCQGALENARGLDDKSLIMNIYEVFEKLYEEREDYRNALTYQKLWHIYSDSIYSEEKIKVLAETKLKFESEQKNREIQLLQKEKEITAAQLQKSRYYLWLFVGGFLSMFVILYIGITTFIRNKNSSKILEAQTEKISEQNDRIMQQNNRFISSLEYASMVQEAVLPARSLFNDNFADYFVINMPQILVSGDFYWAKKIGRFFYLAVADCTGHGVPGGFMSMMGIAFLNDIISGGRERNVSEVLNILRERIKGVLHQSSQPESNSDGMDIALCRFNLENGHLCFAGSYLPLMLFRQGELTIIKADKMPIGHSRNEESFKLATIECKSGDRIYLTSDGLTDQFNASGDKFGSARLKDLLTAHQHLDMKSQQEIIMDSFIDWKGNQEQTDDVLMVGVELSFK